MSNPILILGLTVVAGIGYLQGTITVGETAIISLLGLVLANQMTRDTSEKRIKEEN